ncbi:lysophospholipid acyltransferase family protein [Desulfonatronovibrio magnus]|uniref:lysophospholipid acyltransferase family protein n=1 Tax=Desulfonatronovibrio magnus TaxID=698827 RepID=UPI0005EB9B4E|nr:lysophospholipid acyltransferase family protein [Desulfonatronovibrio magnus]
MPFKEKLVHWIQAVDYEYLLPGMSRMPLNMGLFFSNLRGRVLYHYDYDWRNQASGVRFVRKATHKAMNCIFPGATPQQLDNLTKSRFVHHSREELQAGLFSRKIMQSIWKKSEVQGIDAIKRSNDENRGVVLVSCHLDSFCMGMVLMGMHGLNINCVNTVRIEDPVIHPSVRRFFQYKYVAMEKLMNGRMKYHETDMDYFYDSLKNGNNVVLMGDIPGKKSSIFIPLFGRSFRMPLGAWYLAKETNSLLGGYVCIYLGYGRYKLVCYEPVEVDSDDPLESLKPVYDFLESWIRKMPERWICADLLSGFSEWNS